MCLFRKKKKESGQHWATDLKTSDDWKLRERWEDYPAPDYNAVHTYCSVAFHDIFCIFQNFESMLYAKRNFFEYFFHLYNNFFFKHKL